MVEIGTIYDLDELERLYNDVNDYLEANINYPGWAKGFYPVREDAERGIKKASLFVLRIGNRIAGSFVLNHIQEEAYSQVKWGVEAEGAQIAVLRVFVVHPDFMRQGVSKKLLDFVKEYASKLGCKTIRLDVTVQNAPAIALYEKCGYSYVGTVDLGLPYEHLKWFRLYELVL